MTSTPIADSIGAHAAPAPNGALAAPGQPYHELTAEGYPTGNIIQPQPRTTMGVVHRDLAGAGRAIASAVPVLEAIAVNPLVDELVAEALEALHAGGLEPVLQAAIDSLRAARLRQQPQFLPAPAMPEQGPQDGA